MPHPIQVGDVNEQLRGALRLVGQTTFALDELVSPTVEVLDLTAPGYNRVRKKWSFVGDSGVPGVGNTSIIGVGLLASDPGIYVLRGFRSRPLNTPVASDTILASVCDASLVTFTDDCLQLEPARLIPGTSIPTQSLPRSFNTNVPALPAGRITAWLGNVLASTAVCVAEQFPDDLGWVFVPGTAFFISPGTPNIRTLSTLWGDYYSTLQNP